MLWGAKIFSAQSMRSKSRASASGMNLSNPSVRKVPGYQTSIRPMRSVILRIHGCVHSAFLRLARRLDTPQWGLLVSYAIRFGPQELMVSVRNRVGSRRRTDHAFHLLFNM